MSRLSNYLLAKFYKSEDHPYRIFERCVMAQLSPDRVLLDAGCGRTMPVLRQYRGHARRLIGVELVDFTEQIEGIESIKSDLANIPLPDASVDIIMSRSVFEHLVDPESVYRELNRILRPGGQLIFLTASCWDYATLIAKMVPNRFHAKIVAKVEGRAEEDVFPTAYKTNSHADVKRLAAQSGFRIEALSYLSQYPNYLMFNGVLFFLGMCYEKLVANISLLAPLRGWILVRLVKPAA